MKKTPRVLAVLAGALLGLTALAGPASATPGGGNHGGGGHGGGGKPNCVEPSQARWLHEFDAKAGTASIQLDKKRTWGKALCKPQEFALVSYATTEARATFPQYLLAQDVQTFEAGTFTKLEFKVAVPTCFMQIDFVFGGKVLPLDHKGDGELYGDRKVGSDRGEGSRSKPLPGNPKHAWHNGDNGGVCAAKPEVTAQSSCNGEVTLALNNRNGNKATTFVVTGENGFTKSVSVPARKLDDDAVVVPAEAAGNIKVTAEGMADFTGKWTAPEGCAQPEAAVKHTCDDLSFTIKNPEGGKSVTATFTPNKGEAKSVTVPAGGTSEPVVFPGQEGLTVTVTGDVTAANGTVTWAKPKDCESPSPSPSTSTPSTPPATTPPATDEPTPSDTPATPTPTSTDEGDEELALTGAAAGSVAGGAALLLIVGAGLFFMARRRKLNFKA